jgi:hypothetical protein
LLPEPEVSVSANALPIKFWIAASESEPAPPVGWAPCLERSTLTPEEAVE